MFPKVSITKKIFPLISALVRVREMLKGNMNSLVAHFMFYYYYYYFLFVPVGLILQEVE